MFLLLKSCCMKNKLVWRNDWENFARIQAFSVGAMNGEFDEMDN